MDKYISGVCNIGKKERESRLKIGIVYGVITILLTIYLMMINTDINLRYLLFFPAFASCIGIYQYYFKFCVYFGVLGKYNFGNLDEQGYTNTQKEYLRNDIKKALTILVYCLVTSVIYTTIIVLI